MSLDHPKYFSQFHMTASRWAGEVEAGGSSQPPPAPPELSRAEQSKAEQSEGPGGAGCPAVPMLPLPLRLRPGRVRGAPLLRPAALRGAAASDGSGRGPAVTRGKDRARLGTGGSPRSAWASLFCLLA